MYANLWCISLPRRIPGFGDIGRLTFFAYEYSSKSRHLVASMLTEMVQIFQKNFFALFGLIWSQ